MNNCEVIAQYWTTRLKNVSMKESFVSLQIEKLTVYARETGVLINDYKSLFENTEKNCQYKRIVIEGEPGCGKTTYVNKLSLDWAENDPYLRSMFDLVFHFPLQLLQADIGSSIGTFVPAEHMPKVKDMINIKNNRILFIFDGFDEISANHSCFNEVLSVLELKKYLNVTVLLTSRISHRDRIPERTFENWLLIKGFGEQTMYKYLANQGCSKDFIQSVPNEVKSLLHLPLFAAMFCSLQNFAQGTIDTVSVYDIVDNYVDSVINFTIRSKQCITKETIEMDMINIGKFATSVIAGYSVTNILKYFPSSEKLWNSVRKERSETDLSKVSVGLLVVKKIPNGIYGGFINNFSFQHQLMAECLVARFLLNAAATFDCFSKSGSNPVSMNPVMEFFSNGFFRKWSQGEFPVEDFLHIELFQNFYYLWFLKLQSVNKFSKLSEIRNISFYESATIGRNVLFFRNLSKCCNLKELSLRRCDISSESLKLFTASMKNNFCSNLEVLDFYQNENVGKENSFFEALKFCPHIKELNFGFCQLNKRSVDALTIVLEGDGLLYLENFDLSFNVTASGALFEVLKRLQTLRSLFIELNSVSLHGFVPTATCCKESYFPSLEELHVSWIYLTADEFDLFINGLKHCKKLKRLIIDLLSEDQKEIIRNKCPHLTIDDVLVYKC